MTNRQLCSFGLAEYPGDAYSDSATRPQLNERSLSEKFMTTAPTSLIADVLVTSLANVLDNLCLERYDRDVVSLHRIEDPDLPPSTVGLRLDRPGLPSLESQFTVRHLGGNVYELIGEIEDGRSRSFMYCLPDPAPLLVPSAPKLASDVARFLLDEMECRLGRGLLRGEITSRPDTASFPVSTPPSAKATSR